MDFYAHQDRARAASRRLAALFVAALVAVVIAVNAAAVFGWWLLGGGTNWPRYFVETNTLVTLLIVLGGAWIEIHRLREGASVLAQRLGARTLDERNPLHRRLRDIAEEIAIGAGVPVPALYVLDDPSINAMAAGERPALAALIVTRGALERLERAELQGVVAHEVAHILGGDTGLNMQLTGALYGLFSLRMAGSRMLHTALERAEGGAFVQIVFLRVVMFVAGSLLSVVGLLGVGAAQLLRAAISRQREYLADALAVQITRDRDGLGGALRRIAGEVDASPGSPPGLPPSALGSALRSAYAPLISHFLLVRPAGPSDWTHTHPPLDERIRRLYGRRMAAIAPPAAMTRPRAAESAVPGAPRPDGASPSAAAYDRPSLSSMAWAHGIFHVADAAPGAPNASLGTPTPRRGDSLEIETIPFARVSSSAHAFGIDGSPNPALAAGRRSTGPATLLITRIRAASFGYDTAGRWLEALVGALPVDERDAEQGAALRWVLSPDGSTLRVPLLELLLARVRRWSSAHRRDLLERCRRAVERDGRVDASEWIYYTLARHRLMGSSHPGRIPKGARSKLAQSRALAALFAMAAAIGEASARNTRDALADAAAMLEVLPPAATPDEVGTGELTQALDTLLTLPPLDKPILLKALRALARTPGDANYEAFLRAVAAAIDCPVPRDPLPTAESRMRTEVVT